MAPQGQGQPGSGEGPIPVFLAPACLLLSYNWPVSYVARLSCTNEP